MYSSCKHVIDRCHTCLGKKGQQLRQGFFSPAIYTEGGERVSWDLQIFGAPSYNNKRYLLSILDAFTHLAELHALEEGNASEVAECLLLWVYRYGCPKILLSDNGSEFKNAVMKELCKILHNKTPSI